MKGEKIVKLVRAFLKKRHPDVRVEAGASAPAYKGITTGPFVESAQAAMKFAFGRDPVFVREGGTIGAILFMEQTRPTRTMTGTGRAAASWPSRSSSRRSPITSMPIPSDEWRSCMTRRAFAARCVCLVAILLAGIPVAGAQTPEFKGEPDTAMANAQESFLKGDMNAASEHIKKAAAYVRAESGKVTKSAAKPLKKAADDLDKLGREVKKGAVKSPDELKKSFAKVDHALAKAWHETAAAEHKAGKDSTNALARAGSGLEGAAKWTGTQLEGGARAAVDAVNTAGQTAGKGARMGADAVGRAFRGIGDGIADVGRKISG